MSLAQVIIRRLRLVTPARVLEAWSTYTHAVRRSTSMQIYMHGLEAAVSTPVRVRASYT